MLFTPTPDQNIRLIGDFSRERQHYYVRVLEIPTPRWSTLRAIEYGRPLSGDVPPKLQQRAWSSPIWYTPAGNKGAR